MPRQTLSIFLNYYLIKSKKAKIYNHSTYIKIKNYYYKTFLFFFLTIYKNELKKYKF